ncbi:conserved hypothetical protein [Verticillium alfalfae VaMs.102]|uniref:C2H2-type domain-containing protein n=1 Tax=Verticillium alfalfae (strain VaMs.102 / ATCC MYA-4576 / FGSC 10136) TaxID=526221 RepID=C9SIP0_VERA1|nr:conserved hypothetical protein [Verticillium alfalfae VaMs.102]EEY18813.1 conserved hypothetical protein [Verticillium alfalfae VaMs.102]
MDSYSSYREPARSPGDRNWEKTERSDSYRARAERSRDRRRSRSPAAVDRYEPRGRRDDHGRDRDDRRGDRRIGSPPANIDRYVPGQDNGGPSLTVNPLMDPVKLPYQVGFSYFGEWWRMNEKIKEDKERQRTGRRREPERPRGSREAQEERDKEKARIQAAYDSYKEDLQAKMARAFVSEHKKEQWFRERYVPDVRDPLRQQISEFRRGGYTQWEQDLESGTFDDFSLEGLPKNDSNGQGGLVEKEEGEAMATNEILGVGDLVPANGADIRDENLFQPTLLFKTIAPHVSRQNLEAFCKEHLGEEEGGFKWLSLSDPNPSKRYHRIGWVMLHPSSETAAATLDRADPVDDEDGEAPKSPVVVSTARGPSTRSMARLPQFLPSQRAAAAARIADGADAEHMHDAEQMEDAEGEEEDEGAVDEDDEVDDEELLVKKKQLDLMIEYLRRVFNFCFYCVFESDSIHELTRKCPGGHLRRPRATLSTAAKAVAKASALGEPFPGKKRGEADEDGEVADGGDRRFRGAGGKAEQQLLRAYNWVKTFEDKVMQILEPDSVDLRKLGGKPIDEAMDEELLKYVRQEDEHKFRCKVPECQKLFKEDHFWKKHVEKRHPEWLEGLKQEAAAGTPRGFNLNTFNMNNMMPIPGFPMPPGGFPGFIPGGTGQGSGWSGDGRDGPGPIRRGGGMGGGGRGGNYRSGPYDRRPNPRYDGARGRGGPSKWGDGGAGGAAVGPREATQGRSLKSYEDLDHVAGGGGGELNY